jgi:hypothetical protein
MKCNTRERRLFLGVTRMFVLEELAIGPRFGTDISVPQVWFADHSGRAV